MWLCNTQIYSLYSAFNPRSVDDVNTIENNISGNISLWLACDFVTNASMSQEKCKDFSQHNQINIFICKALIRNKKKEI